MMDTFGDDGTIRDLISMLFNGVTHFSSTSMLPCTQAFVFLRPLDQAPTKYVVTR